MLVLVPILAMLALGFVVPDNKGISAKKFLLTLGVGFLLFLGIRSCLPEGWIYTEGEMIVRVRGQVEHLLRMPDWQHHPVIIFEGSSVTQFGVNGELLEKLLAQQGIKTTVLQLSLSGANHFERLFMLQLFFETLGARHREELKKAPTILLSEVFDAYDQEPLYLWEKEAYSPRAIAWTTPKNGLEACKAKFIQKGEKNLSQKTMGLTPFYMNYGTDPFWWQMGEHLLLNRFAVGVFSSMQPLNYRKKVDGFFPLTGTKKNFHYRETQKMYEKALHHHQGDLTRILHPSLLRNPEITMNASLGLNCSSGGMYAYSCRHNSSPALPYQPLRLPRHERDEISGLKETKPLPYPGWSFYYRELQRECAPIVTMMGFYALPTLEPERREYQLAFSETLPPHTKMLGPVSSNVMRDLFKEEDWFDGVHPQEKGSRLFTKWLAGEIQEQVTGNSSAGIRKK